MSTLPFKRLLLTLMQQSGDRAALEATARFAETLGLPVTAALLQDAVLACLAGYAGLRELHPPGLGWQPVDPEAWRVRQTQSLENMRAHFERAFAGFGPRARLLDADEAAGGLTGNIRKDDILVLVQPASPADYLTQQFSDLVQSALQTSAALMLMPPAAAPIAGPVIAVSDDPEERCLRIAMEIAAIAGQPLLVRGRASLPGVLGRLSREFGVQVVPDTAPVLPLERAHMLSPARRRGSLVVTARRALGPQPLAALTGQPSPVLIVGGEENEDGYSQRHEVRKPSSP